MGLEALKICAEKLIFKQNASQPQQSSTTETNENLNQQTTNNNEASTPALKTPNTASSESNRFYNKRNKFFPVDQEPEKDELDLEIKRADLKKEIDAFRAYLLANNYANLKTISSTKSFWLT